MASGRRVRVLVIYVVSTVLTGCASVKTLPSGDTSDEIRLRPPISIHVQPFETDGGMWQGSTSASEKRAEIRDWLAGSLLRHLATLAATHLHEGEPAPVSGWLVSGRFLRVNPGSRMQRTFLGGVGAGASKLETRVDVFDLAVSSTEPILSFTTTGGSNLAAAFPGAMTAMDDDIERTAREIQDFLKARLWPLESEPGWQARPPAIDEVEINPPPRRPR